MGKLSELADKVEALDGPYAEIFTEAYEAIYPKYATMATSWASDVCHAARYELLVSKEAWLDAALLLVPEGWLVVHLSELGGAGGCICKLGNPGTSQEALSDHGAKTMALALLATALRAKDADNGQ